MRQICRRMNRNRRRWRRSMRRRMRSRRNRRSRRGRRRSRRTTPVISVAGWQEGEYMGSINIPGNMDLSLGGVPSTEWLQNMALSLLPSRGLHTYRFWSLRLIWLSVCLCYISGSIRFCCPGSVLANTGSSGNVERVRNGIMIYYKGWWRLRI